MSKGKTTEIKALKTIMDLLSEVSPSVRERITAYIIDWNSDYEKPGVEDEATFSS